MRFAGFSNCSTCSDTEIRIRRVHSSAWVIFHSPDIPVCTNTLILDKSHSILVSHNLGDVKLLKACFASPTPRLQD